VKGELYNVMMEKERMTYVPYSVFQIFQFSFYGFYSIIVNYHMYRTIGFLQYGTISRKQKTSTLLTVFFRIIPPVRLFVASIDVLRTLQRKRFGYDRHSF
jgi:hypothetical protein